MSDEYRPWKQKFWWNPPHGNNQHPTGGRAEPDSAGMNTPRFKRVQKRSNAQILAGMGARAKQKWFRRMGYDVAVDGIEGPQTRAAQKAFLNGVHGNVFNRRQHGAHGPSKPQHLRDTGSAPVSGPGGSPGGGPGGAPGGAPDAGMFDGLIDANKYAQGSVNAEYGPLLGQIGRDISQGRRQGTQNIADIEAWFKQLEGTRAQGETGNKSALDAALADMRGANMGMTNALGGKANQGSTAAGGYEQAAEGGVQGVGLAQGNFDRNMGTILAAQGTDARRGEQGRQSQIMADLIGKRQDLFQAKGSALSKAMAEAQILRTQQRGQMIDQGQNLAMGPLQIAQAQQNLQQGAANQKMSMRERMLQYDTNKAQLQDFLDQLDQKTGGKLNFNELDEQSRLGLANSIGTMAAGANGNVAAWARIKEGLQMAGYDIHDPKIRRYGLGILATLPGYKATKGYPGWKKPKKGKKGKR